MKGADGAVGFIGAGAMGEAIIRGLRAAKGAGRREIFVHDVRRGRAAELGERFGATPKPSVAALVKSSGTVIVAVKPKDVPAVLKEIPRAASRGRLFVSIAAGIRTASYLSALGDDAAVARAMPNTPAQVGLGCTGIYYSRGVAPAQRARARGLFAALGAVAEFPREELLDVVTALSGSGPAYAFLFIEALADGAVRAGMGREDALLLAAATVEGAGRMVRETGKHPGELKDLVTSPGGTTAAGVAALERGAFRGTVMDAVFAAWQRCKEISG